MQVDVFQVVYDYVDFCEKFPPFDPFVGAEPTSAKCFILCTPTLVFDA